MDAGRDGRSSDCLPRLLHHGCIVTALVLTLLVLAAPAAEQIWVSAPMIRLFAQDVVLRRVTLVAALGLIVTARVFFQRKTAGPDSVS